MVNTTNPPGSPFDNSPFIVPLFKDQGKSSFDCIRDLKRDLFTILGKGKGRRKLKIGHFGTLDPFADGALLVGTGKALKLMQFFQQEMSKSYVGVGNFSHGTDTGDREGKILKTSPDIKRPNLDELNELQGRFLGPYWQKPPYFSAVKHEGRPLYEWAREGVFIEKEPVKREIYELRFMEAESERVKFFCKVSSGTYVRGLWTDIAQTFGLEGHLQELKRTAWGDIGESDLYHHEAGDVESLKEAMKRPHELWELPKVYLKAKEALCFCQGQYLSLKEAKEGLEKVESSFLASSGRGWVFDSEENLLGLGEVIKEGTQSFLKVSVSLT